MEDRDEGADAGGKQFIDQCVVKIDTLRIDFSGAVGQKTRPGEGEAVVLHAHLLHQCDVFLEAMVMIAGDVAGVALKDLAVFMGKVAPDVAALAVFIGGAFDLVGRSRSAPDEILPEAHGNLLWSFLLVVQQRFLPAAVCCGSG